MMNISITSFTYQMNHSSSSVYRRLYLPSPLCMFNYYSVLVYGPINKISQQIITGLTEE